MASLRRSLIALVAALSVVLSLGAAGRDQLFCRMLGRVTSACCCAVASAASRAVVPGDCADGIERPDCCERIEQRAAGAPGAREAGARVPAAPVALAPAWFAAGTLPRPASRATLRVQARAPPSQGTPLFLKHCSFLS
jgi:hypothetical protein